MTKLTAILAVLLLLAAFCNVGESQGTIFIVNTRQSPGTGNVEALHGASPEYIRRQGVDAEFLFYSYDFSKNRKLVMKLIDSTPTPDFLPDDSYDRYYIHYQRPDGSAIDLAALNSNFRRYRLNIHADVTVLEPGFVLDGLTDDIFMTGISQPIVFSSGGLLVEFGPDTDLRQAGRQLRVDFGLRPTFFVAHTVEMGNETVMAETGPAVIGLLDQQDLPGFPMGIFNINVVAPLKKKKRLIMTLMDNSGIDPKILPEGHTERYYFTFSDNVGSAIKSVKKKRGGALNEDVELRILEPGYVLPGSSIAFTNGGLVVEFVPGSNFITEGAEMKMVFKTFK